MAKKQSKKATAKPPKKTPKWLFPALLVFGFILVYPFIFDKKVSLGGDNASYYILGKALSSGEGYTNIHVPGKPAHNHFPPGYPAILGVFMVFTGSITFLKILNGVFLLGTSFITYLLLRRFTENDRMAFVISILLFFNFHLLSYSTIMMSEVPFLFFATLAMLFFVRLEENEKPFYKDLNFYFLLLTSSFAYHIRTAGIALVAGFALYLLIRKKWAIIGAYLGGFALLGVPWFLRGKSLGGSAYLDQLFMVNPYRPEEGAMQLADWFTRFGNNLTRYLGKEIPHGLFPGFPVDYAPDASGNVFYGILIVVVLVFGLIKLPKYNWLLAGYLMGTFGILLLWPDVWFGTRFILPLIPILLFLFVYGLYALVNFGFSKISVNTQLNPLLFLILILFFTPQLKQLSEAADESYQPKFKNYFEVASWANTNLPEDAIICTRKPGLFYLFAGRQVAKFANTPDYNELFADMNEWGFTHVVIDQLGYAQTGRFLVPAVQDNPEKFQLLHQTTAPETYLLSYQPTLGYTGEWLVEDQDNGYYKHTKQGKGTYNFPDGRIYTGQFSNNQPNGEGTMTYPNGQVQSGTFVNGQLISETE